VYTANDLNKTFNELCDETSRLMKVHKVPGVSVGLILNGEEFVQGFGVTSLEHPLPVTIDTLFQNGSRTKTITATAVMRLVEQGLLELDKPVKAYVKHFRVKDKFASDKVTVRQLLDHTSGWVGDYIENTGDGDDALAKYTANMANLKQLTPLGEVWSYNSSAFSLAGYVIESVTKKPYEQAVRDLVLEPLGLSNSFFFPAEVMVRRFAIGHGTEKLGEGEEKVVTAVPSWSRSNNAAGGLCTSLKDQLRYARFHMGDGQNWKGERILSKESMKLMQTPTVATNDDKMAGLSWLIHDYKKAGQPLRVVGHDGAVNGHATTFWFIPKEQCAFTVLTNASAGRLFNRELNDWVMNHYFGIVEKVPEPLEQSVQELSEYIGVYKEEAFGTKLELKLEENSLVMHVTNGDFSSLNYVPPVLPPINIGVYAKDRLIELDGEGKGNKIECLRKQGKIAWLRTLYRVHAKQ
jgi:CubicO group peptidase (beta-lactamase class C family)